MASCRKSLKLFTAELKFNSPSFSLCLHKAKHRLVLPRAKPRSETMPHDVAHFLEHCCISRTYKCTFLNTNTVCLNADIVGWTTFIVLVCPIVHYVMLVVCFLYFTISHLLQSMSSSPVVFSCLGFTSKWRLGHEQSSNIIYLLFFISSLLIMQANVARRKPCPC